MANKKTGTVVFRFRVSSSVAEQVQQKADEIGLEVSEYLRALVKKGMAWKLAFKPEKEPMERILVNSHKLRPRDEGESEVQRRHAAG